MSSRPVCYRLLTCALALSAFAAIPSVALAQVKGTAYGVGNDGNIYAVNLDTKTTSVFGATGQGALNAAALDPLTMTVYYRTGLSGNGDLWAYNLLTQTKTDVISASLLKTNAADGTFYNGYYWYVTDGTNTLNRIKVSGSTVYNSSTVDLTQYTSFDGSTSNTYSFGDIAVSSAGVLYGQTTSGTFFSVDLAPTKTGGSLGVFNSTSHSQDANVLGSSLQLGFDASGQTLYGVSTSTGAWYNISTSALTFGEATSVSGFNTVTNINDMTSAVAAPEPGSLALAAAVALPLFGLTRRSRRK